MIQRIQSLYLSLTTLFSVLFLSGSLIRFTDDSGNILIITPGGLSRVAGEAVIENLNRSLLLTILLSVIPVLSFVSIFLYGSRKLQMRFVIILFILTILLIIVLVISSFLVIRNYDADIIWEIKMILPLLMAICSYLAYRGIKKDEDLVKSYDRLR